MVVAEINELKQQAQRRVEFTFAEPVEPEVFLSLGTVREVDVVARTVMVTFAGSVDPVLKAAARYEVETIVSHDGDRESAFLAYYHEGDGDAA
jgi:ABC-2 type transport system ATP-binding protein